MKKVFFISIVLLIIGVISCEKDTTTIHNNLIGDSQNEAVNGQYNITYDNLGWLVFNDRTHIMTTILDLQVSVENYDIQYSSCLSQIPDGLTAEQEQAAIEQCGYVEDGPIINFENSFGTSYVSIRSKLESDIDAWLVSQTLPIDFSNMPAHVFNDPYLGAVYNQYGEVQVGGIVYFTKPDGRQVGIPRADLTYEIVQNFRTIFADPNFDPNTLYNGIPLLDDSLKSAFLYGEQIPLSKKSGKGAGTNVLHVIGSVLLSPILIIWDATKWLNNSSGNIGTSCFTKLKFNSQEWSGNNNEKLVCDLKLIDILVIGQWEKAKSAYFIGKHKRLATMKTEGDCETFLVDNHPGCTTLVDEHNILNNNERRRKSLSRTNSVGLYRSHGIHENDISHDYFYCKYYKDNDLKVTIH